MEVDTIQPKHTKMNPIGAKAELGLVVLCAGDRKTSLGCDFPRSPKTMQKGILSQPKIWKHEESLQHEESSFG